MVFVEFFRKACLCLLCLTLLLPMTGCSGGSTESEQDASAPIEDDPALTPPVGTDLESTKKKK